MPTVHALAVRLSDDRRLRLRYISPTKSRPGLPHQIATPSTDDLMRRELALDAAQSPAFMLAGLIHANIAGSVGGWTRTSLAVLGFASCVTAPMFLSDLQDFSRPIFGGAGAGSLRAVAYPRLPAWPTAALARLGARCWGGFATPLDGIIVA